MGGLLDRGMQLARDGRWDEARGLLLQVVAGDPGSFDAWLWLGAIADDPADSVVSLERAFRINRNSIRAQKGLEWARERLAQAESPAAMASGAPEAPAPSLAADAEPAVVAEAVEESTTLSLEEGAVDLEPTPLQGSQPDPASGLSFPGRTGSQSIDDEAEATLPPVQSLSQLSSLFDLGWKEGDAFSDEGLSPVSITDDQTPSPPSASEPVTPSLVEIPPAILSAFQSDDFLQAEEENPLKAPFDNSSAHFSLEALQPSVDEGATPTKEPFGGEPKGADEAVAPMESWDALIARLRALDDQHQPDTEEPPPADESPEANTGDMAPASDLFVLPSSVSPAPDAGSVGPAPGVANAGAVEAAPGLAYAGEPAAGALPAEPAPIRAGESTTELVEKGKADLDGGRIIEAIQSFKQALALDPDHVEATEQLGVAQYQAGDVDAAIAAFETLVELKPAQAEGYANLGFLYAEKGAAGRAIEAFQEALKRDSGLVEAHMSLADLYKSRGSMDDAIKAWSAAAFLRPDLVDAHVNLGEAYAERGQLTEAIWEFRRVVDLKPDNARTHLRLGQLVFQSGRSADAAREYGNALRISPALPEAHYGLALCLEEQGDRSQAIKELEEALAVRPDYLEADEKLARLRAATAGAPVEKDSEKEKDDQEKKSRWGFFKRDKK